MSALTDVLDEHQFTYDPENWQCNWRCVGCNVRVDVADQSRHQEAMIKAAGIAWVELPKNDEGGRRVKALTKGNTVRLHSGDIIYPGAARRYAASLLAAADGAEGTAT